jgi:TatD DNase family protein
MVQASNPTFAYQIRDSIYLNVTNHCTAACTFCPRSTDPTVKGYNLALDEDPSGEDLLEAIGSPEKYKNVVFCGFGEPTLRLDNILHVTRHLRGMTCKIRLNTNGHGNLIHKRPIVPELVGEIDEISISLNANNADDYDKIMKPAWGKTTYLKTLRFIRDCRSLLPKVTVTAVNSPGFDADEFKRFVTKDLEVNCLIRAYDKLGD